MPTLKSKIIVLTCSAVLLSTTLIATVNYFHIQNVVFSTAIEKLAGETRLIAQQFRTYYDQMSGDAQVLARTPPIAGIMRSSKNGGRDPRDGSTTESLRDRLSTIFVSVLEARPYYTQLRYIGIADGGRELVRVNRTATGVAVVAPADLQQKSQEPYFSAGVKTARDAVFFSEVTYNREHGKVEKALIPTVRAVLPVYDPSGKIFGLVVINANYQTMLHNAFVQIAPRNTTYVVNSFGDYMKYAADGSISPLELHGNYTRPPPDFISEIAKTGVREKKFDAGNSIAYFVSATIGGDNPDALLRVVVQVPKAALFSPAAMARDVSLVLGSLLIAVCLAAALFAATRFTAPLNRMTEAIRRSAPAERPDGLPLDRHDEVGELARAFAERARALAESEARSSVVIDHVIDGFLTVDETGVIESFNPSCERIFGYAADEVLGRVVFAILPGLFAEELFGSARTQTRSGGDPASGVRIETLGRRKDRSEFPIELSVSELTLGDRLLRSIVVRDVTERKSMERMKDEFIAAINRQLRPPLAAIQGTLSQLIAESEGQGDDKSRELLQLSLDNSQYLSRLIGDILDVEEIALGRVSYDFETADIAMLIQRAVENLLPHVQKRRIAFDLNLDLPDTCVRVDAQRFVRALVNILSNAVRNAENGRRVAIRAARDAEASVRIAIETDAPGLADDFRDRVFNRFAPVHEAFAGAQERSGFDLSIAKAIVESHGGTVAYSVGPGRGIIFSLVVPSCPAPGLSA